MRVRFDEHAEKELDAASDHYRLIEPNLSDDLIATPKKTIALLLQSPMAGYSFTRRVLLDLFPYQLIYRVEGDEIVIDAVAHQKRRPGTWRKRAPAKS